MFAAVDVDYHGTDAHAACVLFHAWTDEQPASEHVVSVGNIVPYQPGAFYRRELPVLLELLGAVAGQFHTVIVDGYVWLAPDRTRPGLGAHLRDALGDSIAVVGVAKTAFEGADADEVLRGTSRRPLYLTSVGTDHLRAVVGVRSMHGTYRIPTLLRRVDALARQRVSPR